MGIFSSGSQKSTQPWDKQYGLWTLLSLISPEFADAFKSAKPNMYKQVFEKEGPESVGTGSPLARLLNDYDPFSFITQLGRPTTGAEQSLMDRSLFGAAAPLDLSQALAQAGAYQNRLTQLPPDAAGGGALGNGYQNMLQAVGGPIGGSGGIMAQRPAMPSLPKAPAIPPPNMGLFGLGMPGASSMGYTGGGRVGGGQDYLSMLGRPQFV